MWTQNRLTYIVLIGAAVLAGTVAGYVLMVDATGPAESTNPRHAHELSPVPGDSQLCIEIDTNEQILIEAGW